MLERFKESRAKKLVQLALKQEEKENLEACQVTEPIAYCSNSSPENKRSDRTIPNSDSFSEDDDDSVKDPNVKLTSSSRSSSSRSSSSSSSSSTSSSATDSSEELAAQSAVSIDNLHMFVSQDIAQ